MYTRLMTSLKNFTRLLSRNHTGIRLGSTTRRARILSGQVYISTEDGLFTEQPDTEVTIVSNPSSTQNNDDFFESFGKPTKTINTPARVVV